MGGASSSSAKGGKADLPGNEEERRKKALEEQEKKLNELLGIKEGEDLSPEELEQRMNDHLEHLAKLAARPASAEEEAAAKQELQKFRDSVDEFNRALTEYRELGSEPSNELMARNEVMNNAVNRIETLMKFEQAQAAKDEAKMRRTLNELSHYKTNSSGGRDSVVASTIRSGEQMLAQGTKAPPASTTPVSIPSTDSTSFQPSGNRAPETATPPANAEANSGGPKNNSSDTGKTGSGSETVARSSGSKNDGGSSTTHSSSTPGSSSSLTSTASRSISSERTVLPNSTEVRPESRIREVPVAGNNNATENRTTATLSSGVTKTENSASEMPKPPPSDTSRSVRSVSAFGAQSATPQNPSAASSKKQDWNSAKMEGSVFDLPQQKETVDQVRTLATADPIDTSTAKSESTPSKSISSVDTADTPVSTVNSSAEQGTVAKALVNNTLKEGAKLTTNELKGGSEIWMPGYRGIASEIAAPKAATPELPTSERGIIDLVAKPPMTKDTVIAKSEIIGSKPLSDSAATTPVAVATQQSLVNRATLEARIAGFTPGNITNAPARGIASPEQPKLDPVEQNEALKALFSMGKKKPQQPPKIFKPVSESKTAPSAI